MSSQSIARSLLRSSRSISSTPLFVSTRSISSARVYQPAKWTAAPFTPSRVAATTQQSIRLKSTDASQRWGPPIVKYEELKPITEQPTDDILLVDVREPDEVALGSIPSSVSLPLSQLSTHLASSYSEGDFLSAHAFPKPLPKQKMIFFCRSGKRSASACELAGKAGYGNVRNYEGSWLEWSKREKEGGGGKNGFDDDD